MKKLSEKTTRLKQFFREDIWILDLEELSKARARFIKYLKVMLITIKTFANERIGFQAVALSFFSTMSVVPFIAIVFGITGGLGLEDHLKELLYDNFQNSQQTIDTIIGFADNIIATAESGLMGLISSLFFFFTVIMLMLNVEKVFNNVWMVEKARNIIKRLSVIIAMLLLSPFVVMAFFTGSFAYSRVIDFLGLGWESYGFVKTILVWTIFAIIITLVFSAMYKFIPNAKVKYGAAFRAAVPAALAFTVVQYGYVETQVFVSRLSAVFGAFAAVPLFMVWINIGWFIILIGAQLSYAFQNVDKYNVEE
ncbi:MAG: YihY/virulence factor BrkB family protein [Firmicutes bacterium]|nr:YihY/virulence factor BrkB family protein [Bacteroidales bacterium]MBR1989141.1 YihY/virulence factor BrkB family protein [Bacillota bacterium]